MSSSRSRKVSTGPWWLFEFLPKSARRKEWPGRLSLLGLYIPWAEPRPIPNRPWKGVPSDEAFAIHSSAVARIAERGDLFAAVLTDEQELPPIG